jgi:hypothetical protein
MHPTGVRRIIPGGGIGAGARDVESVQRVTGFARIKRTSAERNQPGQPRVYRDRDPAQMFRRDDMERAFQPLATAIACECRGMFGDSELMNVIAVVFIAGFNPKMPFLGVFALLRACHDRNRYLPQPPVSTAEARAI